MINCTYWQCISICVKKSPTYMIKSYIPCKKMSYTIISSNSKSFIDNFLWKFYNYLNTLIQLLGGEFCPCTTYFCNFGINAVSCNYCLNFKFFKFIGLYY